MGLIVVIASRKSHLEEEKGRPRTPTNQVTDPDIIHRNSMQKLPVLQLLKLDIPARYMYGNIFPACQRATLTASVLRLAFVGMNGFE